MRRAPAGIGCIVLAAGAATRFGSDKRLAQFGDSTLLDYTLSRLTPLFTQRLVVLRGGDTALAEAINEEWEPVFAADADKGMGHSLAAAMTRTRQWDGAVIALADMPWVRPETYAAVAAQVAPDKLVVPFYQGQRGNPVGIGRAYFAELAALDGDQGARGLLQRHAAAVIRLELDDSGILRDVDTPEALDGEAKQ